MPQFAREVAVSGHCHLVLLDVGLVVGLLDSFQSVVHIVDARHLEVLSGFLGSICGLDVCDQMAPAHELQGHVVSAFQAAVSGVQRLGEGLPAECFLLHHRAVGCEVHPSDLDVVDEAAVLEAGVLGSGQHAPVFVCGDSLPCEALREGLLEEVGDALGVVDEGLAAVEEASSQDVEGEGERAALDHLDSHGLGALVGLAFALGCALEVMVVHGALHVQLHVHVLLNQLHTLFLIVIVIYWDNNVGNYFV